MQVSWHLFLFRVNFIVINNNNYDISNIITCFSVLSKLFNSHNNSMDSLGCLNKIPHFEWLKPVVPNSFRTRDRFHERQFFHRLWGVGMVSRWFKHITFTRPPHRWSEGSRAQEVMQAMGSSYKYRWNFSHLPAIHLLLCSLVPAGQGPVAVCGPVVGDCWLKQQRFIFSQFWSLEFQDQVSAGLLSSEDCEGRSCPRPLSL